MSAKEGVSRIAKAISAVSWLMAIGGVVISILLSLNSGREATEILLVGCFASVVVLGGVQGLVWIIDGFAGNKGESSSILWPMKRKRSIASQSFGGGGLNHVQLPKSRPELHGVSGWLAFFIITLAVLSPLAVLGGTSLNIEDAERLYPNLISFMPWQNYKKVSWVVAFAAAGSFLWCGWVLWKQHLSSSVRTAITCIWGVPLMLIVCDIIAADYFLHIGPSETLNKEALIGLLRGFSYATIWTLYLKLSRRVRNTYSLHAPFPSDRGHSNKIEPKV